MSDSISNFITIIRNASLARKETCTAKYSQMHQGIADILKKEGYISGYNESEDAKGHKSLVIKLKYVDETPAITDIQRVSKSGRRLYYRSKDIPRVLGGLGIGILTTNQGIMRDRDARRDNIGGELLCAVW